MEENLLKNSVQRLKSSQGAWSTRNTRDWGVGTELRVAFGLPVRQFVVVGGGYAAVGAARAASRLRCRYLLRAFNPRAKPRRSASWATAPTLWARVQ